MYFSTLLFLLLSVSAPAAEPAYAFSQVRIEGLKGTVRVASISALNMKTSAFCLGELETFRRNISNSRAAVLEKQECLATLPLEMAPITTGLPIPGAAYIAYTSTTSPIHSHGWHITYLNETSNPHGFCEHALPHYLQIFETAKCISSFSKQ